MHVPLAGVPRQLRQLVWARLQWEGSCGRCGHMLSGPIPSWTFLNELFQRDMTCATAQLTSLDFAMGYIQPWSPTNFSLLPMELLPAPIALGRIS